MQPGEDRGAPLQFVDAARQPLAEMVAEERLGIPLDQPPVGGLERVWHADLVVKKYRASAPKLVLWLEANVSEGLSVYALPRPHRRRLRTSKMLERFNAELKRQARVAGLFPNDASLFRLVSAVLLEVSDDWEMNRKYLTMGPG